MNDLKRIDFKRFYVIEFLSSAAQLVEDNLQDESSIQLKELLNNLKKEEDISTGIETLAQEHGSGELSIYLFDIIDRIGDYPPSVAYDALPDIVEDFVNASALMMEEPETAAAVKKINMILQGEEIVEEQEEPVQTEAEEPEAEPVGEAQEPVQEEEIPQTEPALETTEVEKPETVSFTEFAKKFVFEKLQKEFAVEDTNPIIQFTRLLIDKAQEDVPQEMEALRSSALKMAPWQISSEFSTCQYIEQFDQNMAEFKRHIIEFEKERSDVIGASVKEGILIYSDYQKEEIPEEPTTIDSILVEYLLSEIEEHQKQIHDVLEQLRQDPKNLKAMQKLIEHFNSFKEISMIHGYPVIENFTTKIIQEIQAGYQKRKKFNYETLPTFEKMFDTLKSLDQLRDIKQKTTAVQQLDIHLTDIQARLWSRPLTKLEEVAKPDESLIPGTDTEQLRLLFNEIVIKSCDSVIAKITNREHVLHAHTQLKDFAKSATLLDQTDTSVALSEFVVQIKHLSEGKYEQERADHIASIYQRFVSEFPTEGDSSKWRQELEFTTAESDVDTDNTENMINALIDIERQNSARIAEDLQVFSATQDPQIRERQVRLFRRLSENLKLIGANKAVIFAEFYTDLFNSDQVLNDDMQSEVAQSYQIFLDSLAKTGPDYDPTELLEVLSEIMKQSTAAETKPVTESDDAVDQEHDIDEDEEDLDAIFKQEAVNYIEHAEKSLADLQKSSKNIDAIREIERSAHSLKASARLMGYDKVGDLAGAVESLCEKLLTGNVSKLSEIIPVITESIGALRRTIDDEDIDNNDLIEKINTLDISVEVEKPQPEKAQVTDDEKPLFSEDDDLLDIFKEESAEFIGIIEQANQKLKTEPHDTKSIDQLENASHSLKSAAKMLGFREIGQIGDAIEQVVEGVKKSEIKNTDIVSDRIAQALEMIKNLTAGYELDAEQFAQLIDNLDLKNLQDEQAISPEETDMTYFIQESQEILERINRDLLTLEKAPSDPSAYENLNRDLHTLKGSSQILGLENIGTIAHLLEEFFDQGQEISQSELDLIFKGIDEVQNLVNAVKAGERDENATYKSIIGKLEVRLRKSFPEQTPTSKGITEQKETTIQPQADNDADTDQVIKITTERLDNLINMAAELVINKSQLTNYLEKLKEISKVIDTDKKKLQTSTDEIDLLLSKINAKESSTDDQDELIRLSSISSDFKNVLNTFEEVTSNFNNITQHFELNLGQISSLSKLLHDDILQVRMVPTEMLFSRFARAVRDLSRKQRKKVNLVIEGETTEMDRAMVESLTDPIMHLVRNAIDHGIEKPKQRKEKNKPEEGTLYLKARRDKNHIVIEVQDDGQGINPKTIKSAVIRKKFATKSELEKINDSEILQYIFHPGFTTKKGASKVSGRGVGLDVVMENLRKLKGEIALNSIPEKGTNFTIRVPLTLAIIQAMLIESQGEILAVPLGAVDETIEVKQEQIQEKENKKYLIFRDKQIPLIVLDQFLIYQNPPGETAPDKRHAIVVNQKKNAYAIFVDRVLRREEIVIKSLGEELNNLEYISGGTILGDGKVVLILDIAAITRVIERDYFDRTVDFAPIDITPQKADVEQPEKLHKKVDVKRKRIKDRSPYALIVDDSLSVRKFVSSVLERNNYKTKLANDGNEAVVAIESQDFDIIITDLEMPEMHGFDLIQKIRSQEKFDDIPIIILTGKAGKESKEKGLKLGANAYIVKPFKENDLLKSLEEFIEL